MTHPGNQEDTSGASAWSQHGAYAAAVHDSFAILALEAAHREARRSHRSDADETVPTKDCPRATSG